MPSPAGDPGDTSPNGVTTWRFPYLRPQLPPPPEWLPWLERSYASRRFSNFGPLSRQLEAELLGDWGHPALSCVLASSGTAALTAPLLASGRRGRLLLPAFTFAASLAAVRQAGLEPLLIDVDPHSWAMAPDILERALRHDDVIGALVVQPFGLRRDLSAHLDLCERHDRLLLIDNAAGLGAGPSPLRGSPLAWEACSLHITKPFGIGEGGVIFAAAAAEEGLRRALNFGLRSPPGPETPGPGFNGKLAELPAAVGLAVRRRFVASLAARRALAGMLLARLREFAELELPGDGVASSWGTLPLRMPSAAQAEALIAAAADLGLEIRRSYRPALTAWPGVASLGPCPVAESLAERLVCLPIYADADATERQQLLETVVLALKRSLRSG